ncbi:MAG: TlpA family protein disulfide reductase, partial [Actinomycetota bacterium]
FDLAVGVPGRFMVGLVTQGPQGNLFVAGGSVDLEFFHLGEDQATGRDPAGSATASFLPIPGSTGPYPSRPEPVTASSGRGVYAVEEFEFDRPGFWEVEVGADLAGEPARATGAFEVLAEPEVPVPGDPAPRTENLTVDNYQADDAPPQAVDSRATSDRIPDRELHDSTVAGAIREGHPVLLTISTPVYCVSKFCGPITDMVAELADEYGDRAEFIHVEVWRNFEEQVVNRAAAEWILAEDKLQEPWVFLIDSDGRVVERWDNVATRQEIEPLLRELPPVPELA